MCTRKEEASVADDDELRPASRTAAVGASIAAASGAAAGVGEGHGHGASVPIQRVEENGMTSATRPGMITRVEAKTSAGEMSSTPPAPTLPPLGWMQGMNDTADQI